jgi:hypothetical protein
LKKDATIDENASIAIILTDTHLSKPVIVTNDVPDHTLIIGNPTKQSSPAGYMLVKINWMLKRHNVCGKSYAKQRFERRCMLSMRHYDGK